MIAPSYGPGLGIDDVGMAEAAAAASEMDWLASSAFGGASGGGRDV